jgi:hypothetical protein
MIAFLERRGNKLVFRFAPDQKKSILFFMLLVIRNIGFKAEYLKMSQKTLILRLC